MSPFFTTNQAEENRDVVYMEPQGIFWKSHPLFQ